MVIKKFLFYCMAVFLLLGTESFGVQFSFDFTAIKTSDLLKIIGKHANKSVIVSDKVGGEITLNLRKVSWREALDAVLQMQGLVKQETANVIIILPAEDLNKNGQSLLRSNVFNLRYASADNLAKLLKPSGVLSEHGKSGALTDTNSLVVADTSDNLAAVKHLVAQLDVPTKQVLIEARIVNADETFIRDLGLEFGDQRLNSDGNVTRAKIAGNQFNFAIAKLSNNSILDVKLAALEEEGRGRVISRPKLLTTDRRAAYIEAGAEIPYQEKTKEGDTTVAFKKAVLSLQVTPEIVAKDKMHLSLQLNQDKVGQLMVNGVPTIDTRKIQTQVSLRSNETVVLGGIYEWSKVTRIRSVPILGQIPVLKILFTQKDTKMERKELLIFVTPRIII